MFDLDNASHTAPCGLPCNALYVIARSCLQRRGNLPEGTPYCRSARCCLRSDVFAYWQKRCALTRRCVSSTRCDIAISQYHTATNPYFATFCPIFFVQGKLHKKCHSFPLHLSLYFIKYASSILFLKILKYYNSTILYNSPKKSHFCATFAHSMHIFKYFHTFF